MDDYIHGRQGALWMITSMDATEGGEQQHELSRSLATYVGSNKLELVGTQIWRETNRANLKQKNKINHGDVRFAHCLVLSDCFIYVFVQLEAAGICKRKKSAS